MKLIKIFLLTIALAVLAPVANAQIIVKVNKKEFKKQEEGFKEAWHAIKEGYKLFEKGEGLFRNARQQFLKAYEYNSENPELNYMIGKCYLYSDDKFEAIEYITKAFELKPEVNWDIHMMLGMAFHQVHEFDKAIYEYERFRKSLNKKEKELYDKDVVQNIRQCENGKDLIKEPKRVVLNNVGKGVNTVYDEYTPFLSQDGETLFFTSRRKLSIDSDRSILDSKYFEDAYYAEFKNGKWGRAKRIEGKVSEKKNISNLAVVGVSPKKDKLYLYKGDEDGGDIFISEFKKGEFKKPKPFNKVNTKYRERSICFSHDSSTMYFVSDIPKSGYGGTDIYFAKKKENGKWGKAYNIGSTLNTYMDELSVNLSENDSILYFSSKGHNSMGGYDVFMSKMDESGNWGRPENLGYPINTPNDDVFYFELPGGKNAYYATNREAGVGGMDIYKLIYLGAEKELETLDGEEPITGVIKPYDNIYFRPSVKLDVDSSLILYGKLIDSENKDGVVGKMEFIDNDKNAVVASEVSREDGFYMVRLPESKSYGIEIVAKNYLLFLDNVDLSQTARDEITEKDFELVRVEVGAKVILQNIYFESGKSVIKPESYTSLANVVRLLENNPTIRVEISGHTDNVGSMKSNLKLSTERAKAVVDYLVANGIEASRLEYKGYAFQFSLFPNNTKEGRAKNRRVEFKILSK